MLSALDAIKVSSNSPSLLLLQTPSSSFSPLSTAASCLSRTLSSQQSHPTTSDVLRNLRSCFGVGDSMNWAEIQSWGKRLSSPALLSPPFPLVLLFRWLQFASPVIERPESNPFSLGLSLFDFHTWMSMACKTRDATTSFAASL